MYKFVILVSLFFISCNSGNDGYKRRPTDTIRTLAIYKLNEPKYDILFRVGRDSLFYVDKDSLTKKKQLSRWYDYYFPMVRVKMDSLGKPMKDSSGKEILYTSYELLPLQYLIKDFNTNIDSLVDIHMPKK